MLLLPNLRPWHRLTTALVFAFLSVSVAFAAEKKILLIAGKPSHHPGDHEHNAGMLLLQKCLGGVKGLKTGIALNGWPQDAGALQGVDAVIIYSDGGARHPALIDDHRSVLGSALARGAGLGLIHYAVEPTLANGHKEFLEWIGGAFEINWSVNPHWVADFTTMAKHPVTRGVKPFQILDEWYFHLRFVDGMKGVTPLLVAIPPASTMVRPNGTHSGNAAVRAVVARGEPQTVAWAYDRPDGGRGFGFTGGHVHNNWGNENFRKLVLNAILWLAKMDVPAQGVISTVTDAELRANLDPKPAPKAKESPKK